MTEEGRERRRSSHPRRTGRSTRLGPRSLDDTALLRGASSRLPASNLAHLDPERLAWASRLARPAATSAKCCSRGEPSVRYRSPPTVENGWFGPRPQLPLLDPR